ncbi:Uu.00g143400.m01.CDS01 [Anthostomella pinea]|uniref:Uu.00g143400.m01.CDS01 n=1 Tax=Anthostomella pinea TaxID=933095 RepID=A0AAI8VRG7_9PEZI|nr:Uu.00g143400.m01.CDS01 [Anthostomella pinea]
MTSSPETPVLRRPNGRPQACEPCRKRKVACDHSQPTCNRCVKRRQGDDCVYVVSSAQTPAAAAAAAISRDTLPSPVSTAAIPRDLLPSPVPTRSSVQRGSNGRPAGKVPDANADEHALSMTSVKHGYLGFTSYTTVYEETQDSLSRLQGSGATQSLTSPGSTSREASVTDRPRKLSPKTRDMCLTVLRNVPDEMNGRLFFRGRHVLRGRPYESWIYYLTRKVTDLFYDHFGHYFESDRNDADLEELLPILCDNTAKPFSDDEAMPDRWLDQFTGKNIRWETLGLIFCLWDFNAKTMAIRKSYTQDEYGCSPTPVTRECLGLCIELCRDFSAANSLLLNMLLRRSVYESMFAGDASLKAWTYHADSVALLTFLGYHALGDTGPYRPTTTSEFKRRLYWNIYTVDMVFVSFTGRPPLMSRRFASTPRFLDFRNDDLFSDPDTLSRAREKLDANGWNTDGVLYSGSPIRARSMLAVIREEIFELALGHAQATSIETLLEIRDREIQTFEAFPDFLHYHAGDLEDPAVVVGDLGSRTLLRLEHLQNLFFVERLLLRHGHTQSDILAVSYELVTFTLPFWTHQDRLIDARADCEWLVMAYAVPGGGILCQELLQPTPLYRRRPSNSSNSPTATTPTITRSAIIQKLSLLVGFLDWIKPTAPNGNLCGDAKTIIQHVLDQALSSAPPGPHHPASISTSTPPAAAAAPTFDWDFSGQVDFDFDLLDTFAWTRPEVVCSCPAYCVKHQQGV